MFSNREWLRESMAAFYPIRELNPIPSNSWNAIFRAESAHGALCIKVLNESTTGVAYSEDELAYVARVMNTFTAVRELTVPCPVLGYDAQLAHRIGEYWCIAYPWIEMQDSECLKEDSSQTLPTIVRAAQTLARIHENSPRACSLIGDRPPSHLALAYSANMWYKHLDDTWQRNEGLMRSRGLTKAGQVLLNEARSACDEFLSHANALFEKQTSDYLVLHGDYRPENMAMSMHKVALWDFDCAHRDTAETEVAYAALSFSGPRFFCGPRRWSDVEAFISAYSDASSIPLSKQLCTTALEWQMIKAMSLSFDERQLRKRLATYRSLQAELKHHRPKARRGQPLN